MNKKIWSQIIVWQSVGNIAYIFYMWKQQQ